MKKIWLTHITIDQDKNVSGLWTATINYEIDDCPDHITHAGSTPATAMKRTWNNWNTLRRKIHRQNTSKELSCQANS